MPSKRKARMRSAITTGASVISAVADLASGGTGIVSGVSQGALLVFDAFAARQQARGDRMLRAAFQAPDDEFPSIIREKLKDEHVRDALLEAMRTALEALADEVMPAIGGLVREYEKENRPPDGFFRGVCRLLQDLSPQEYASFTGFVTSIASAGWRDERQTEASAVRPGDEWARAAEGAPTSGLFVIVHSTAIEEGGRSIAAVGCDPAHASRLFHLLDREHLARVHAQGRGGDDIHLKFRVGTARRIARIL